MLWCHKLAFLSVKNYINDILSSLQIGVNVTYFFLPNLSYLLQPSISVNGPIKLINYSLKISGLDLYCLHHLVNLFFLIFKCQILKVFNLSRLCFPCFPRIFISCFDCKSLCELLFESQLRSFCRSVLHCFQPNSYPNDPLRTKLTL